MKRKNTIIVFSAVLICFLLFTVVSIFSLANLAQENTKEINTMLTYRLYDEISTGINEPIAVSKAMCCDEFFIEAAKKEATMSEDEAVAMMKKYLEKLKTEFGYDTAFFISDKTHRYFTHEGLNKIVDVVNDAHDIWYKNFVDTNEKYIIDVDTDEVNGVQWTLFMDFRLEDENGNFLGVCGVGTRMYNIQKVFTETQNNHNVKINFVDKNGLVQIDTEDFNIENDHIDMSVIDPANDDLTIHISDEKHELTVFKFIEPLNWYLVVRSSTDDINRNFVSIIIINVIISFVITVAVMSILAIIVRRSDKRSKLADRMSKQLSATSDIYISVYELDLINDTFNAISDTTGISGTDLGVTKTGAKQNIREIYEKNTDPSSRKSMLEFVDLSTLNERLRNVNTITTEFLSAKGKWRRARFIVSDRIATGDVAHALYLVEDIDEEKRDSDKIQNTAKLLTSQLGCLANIYTSVHDVDVPNDSFTIIKMNDSVVQTAIGNDVHNAQQVLRDAMTKLTDESCRKEVLEFIEFDKIEENVSETGTATVEFINSRGKWCRGRFIVAERTEDGKLSHVIWAVENIDTEKRERDRLTEDARSLSSQIASLANVYIAMFDVDLKSDTFHLVKSDNEMVNRLVGDKSENAQKLIYYVMDRITDPSSLEEVRKFINFDTLGTRLENIDTVTLEFLAVTKKWVRIRFMASQRTESGKLSHVMWLAEDIDNERSERNELIDASQRAIAASEAQSAFLSNMSDKLRTPITTVLDANEIILGRSGDEEITRCANIIKHTETDLLGLVTNILDFSKIETGKMEIIPVDYDLSEVVDSLVESIKPKAEEKGLKLNLDINRQMPRFLNGDETHIKQIIGNLLSNAVRYTDEGTVTFCVRAEKISGEPDSVMLNVIVKDNGSGIKKEDLIKLRSEFDRIEGLGLGISITKRMLEMMDSSLNIESIYGLGSKFSFELKQTVVKWDELGESWSDNNI